MKDLILVVAVFLCASPTFAQLPGSLGAYADTGGINCNLLDATTGLLSVHIVHTQTNGATAVEFAAPQPECFLPIQYLSWSSVFPVALGNPIIGDPDAVPPVLPGASIAYGGCLSTGTRNILVGTISYFVGGLTAPCCLYPLLPHQMSGLLSMTDCASPFPAKHPINTEAATINADLSCECGVWPTYRSTWGAVKAIYRTDG